MGLTHLVVQPGDGLYRIAQRVVGPDVPLEAKQEFMARVLTANGLNTRSVLHPDRILVYLDEWVPQPAAPPPAPHPTAPAAGDRTRSADEQALVAWLTRRRAGAGG